MKITRKNPAPKAFVGRNFVTPTVLEYIIGERGVYEISRGEGIYREPLFGVTVSRDRIERDHKASKCCRDLDEAYAYVREMEATP